jgi:hypothetical protein
MRSKPGFRSNFQPHRHLRYESHLGVNVLCPLLEPNDGTTISVSEPASEVDKVVGCGGDRLDSSGVKEDWLAESPEYLVSANAP